jgi:hypothetical protein
MMVFVTIARSQTITASLRNISDDLTAFMAYLESDISDAAIKTKQISSFFKTLIQLVSDEVGRNNISRHYCRHSSSSGVIQ